MQKYFFQMKFKHQNIHLGYVICDLQTLRSVVPIVEWNNLQTEELLKIKHYIDRATIHHKVNKKGRLNPNPRHVKEGHVMNPNIQFNIHKHGNEP